VIQLSRNIASKSELIKELFTDEELAKGMKIKILKAFKPILCKECQKLIDQEISELVFDS